MNRTLTTAYSYDDIGNLLAQVTTGEREIAYRYSYNRNGNITGEVRTEGDTTTESTYAYDALGQLTSFMQSTGYGESYTYDKVGNMTRKVISGMDGGKVALSMTYNKGNQMVSMANGRDKIAYSYDKNGSMVKKVLISREYGRLTDTYAYNALDQLTSYVGYDGYQQIFTYDANGMRLSKSEKGNASRSTLEELLRGNISGLPEVIAPTKAEEDYSWATTEYLYDLTQEYYQVIQKNTADETTVYEYGLERIAEYTNDAKHSYVYDGRGSVVLGAGYTPFGDQMGTVKVDGYGYNAEDYDVATGMLNLRARQYEPAMNRFSVKDIYPSNSLVGASFNSYVYTYNNPVGFVDANGLSASSLTKALTSTGRILQGASASAAASALFGVSVPSAVTGKVQSASKIAATQASKNKTTAKANAAQKASGAAAQAKQQLTASNKVQRESVTQTTGGMIASCSGYKTVQSKSVDVFVSEMLNATVKVEKGVVLSTDKNAAGRLVMPAGMYSPQEIISYVNQNGDEQARRELMNAIAAGNSLESALQSYVAMHKETATLSAWEPSGWEKTGQVIEQAILGDYAENRTAIGTAAQIAVSFIPGVDTVTDIRDASYSFQELRNHPSWPNAGWAALDLIGFIPVIGNIKYLKHADDAADAAGMLAKHGDEFVDAASDLGKHADIAADIVKHGEIVLSNTDMKHIYNRHAYEAIATQSKYLSDETLEAILQNRSFFSPTWTYEDINKFVQQALDDIGCVDGKHLVEYGGETFTVIIENGKFKTAYGSYKFSVNDFRERGE